MFDSLSSIWKYFEASEKVGWIAVTAGSLLMLSAEVDHGWLTGLDFVGLAGQTVIIVGAAIVVVNAVSRAWMSFSKWSEGRRERLDTAVAERKAEENALANIEALDEHGLVQLIWLLANDRRRFQYSNVLFRAGVARHAPNCTAIYELRPIFWENRERLLEEHDKLRIPQQFPATRYVA
ncbi:hypothetical protein H9Q09_00985 [Aurantimonas sp. DM33-3]|uniref:hypothetical protein n=1 Tax=Aurantimonas sp. DM33-3 TaxID=2766955 RepID=UPI001652A74C|nr:hypothetical protein [Aurantimonas sp. DM33-3]MBC6714759.1 hypothetical protein [Aurantimonas sp. DM33-3]